MCLAVPGIVESLEGELPAMIGNVRFGPLLKKINMSFLPEVEIGDYILAHVGVAISVLDEQDAINLLKTYGAYE